MNFWVAKMYGNNTHSMEVQKYRNRSHEALPQLEVTLTNNQYCKSQGYLLAY